MPNIGYARVSSTGQTLPLRAASLPLPHIRRNSTKIKTPDLMIVMMNPGSSYPLDGIENNTIASAS